jgi:hypothetical protein
VAREIYYSSTFRLQRVAWQEPFHEAGSTFLQPASIYVEYNANSKSEDRNFILTSKSVLSSKSGINYNFPSSSIHVRREKQVEGISTISKLDNGIEQT